MNLLLLIALIYITLIIYNLPKKSKPQVVNLSKNQSTQQKSVGVLHPYKKRENDFNSTMSVRLKINGEYQLVDVLVPPQYAVYGIIPLEKDHENKS
jgi:hypothetical protein